MATATKSVASLTSLMTKLSPLEPLRSIDLDAPFVTFTLDSSKINDTLHKVLSTMKGLQNVVTQVVSTVDSHSASIDALRGDLDEVTKRVGSVEFAVAEATKKIEVLTAQMDEQASKMRTMELRMKQVEASVAAIKPLEEAVHKMKGEVHTLQGQAQQAQEKLKDHEGKLQQHSDKIEDCRKNVQVESARVTTVYSVFEMDEAKIKALAGKGGRGASGESWATDYCMALPAFQAIARSVEDRIRSSEQRTKEALEETRKKVENEMNMIRSKLGEKVDLKRYEPFEGEVREALKKQNELQNIVSQIANEVRAKATKEDCEKSFAEINQKKADRGDLIALVCRDDLVPLEDDVAALQKAFDSLCSKMDLEIKQMKMDRDSVICSATDPTLLGRVAKLEASAAELYDIKADKRDVGDRTNLPTPEVATRPASVPPINSRPHTPTAEDVKRHGQLAPIASKNPNSARGDGQSRGSIPETVRPPTPPLNYTSSPVKYVPNNAKFRAGAVIFDSEGNRTSASVTAAVAVGNRQQHLQNIANNVAGNDVIPHDHIVHQIPNN